MIDDRISALFLFPDHFSGHASDYARHRPDYPESLFDFLAAASPARRLAWDCATGSGQAAMPLAARFDHVIATDASEKQIAEGGPDPRIDYRVAPAEESSVADRSVDLITVAQALHWFDRHRFWKEAERVLVPRGVIAVWAYDLPSVSGPVDPVVRRLAREVVGPWWPAERRIVDEGYGRLEFPFEELPAPAFRMQKSWTLADLLGYLRTWSATRRYLAAQGEDAVSLVERELSAAWGDSQTPRSLTWPIDLRVGRMPHARETLPPLSAPGEDPVEVSFRRGRR
ncbi:MAG: class I SAM-dependent methyltransferase [Acidobacteriota bacterium]